MCCALAVALVALLQLQLVVLLLGLATIAALQLTEAALVPAEQ
jgi:hypothetical protein